MPAGERERARARGRARARADALGALTDAPRFSQGPERQRTLPEGLSTLQVGGNCDVFLLHGEAEE